MITSSQTLRPYQKLVAWQEAHKLCRGIYEITKSFPKIEMYRLVDQMCRAAASAPTNIAEGSRKTSQKERARYYETSLCSLEELHYQYVLALDLSYIPQEQFAKIEPHIRRTSFLIHKLHASCFS